MFRFLHRQNRMKYLWRWGKIHPSCVPTLGSSVSAMVVCGMFGKRGCMQHRGQSECLQRQSSLSGSKFTPVSCADLVCPPLSTGQMRNDPVLCQTSEMALPESVRFQYIDHPARGRLGCFDNRIKLASEEGMICWEILLFTEVIFPLVLHLSTKYQ